MFALLPITSRPTITTSNLSDKTATGLVAKFSGIIAFDDGSVEEFVILFDNENGARIPNDSEPVEIYDDVIVNNPTSSLPRRQKKVGFVRNNRNSEGLGSDVTPVQAAQALFLESLNNEGSVNIGLTGPTLNATHTGYLFTWGYGYYGSRGQGDSATASFSSPVQLGTDQWAIVATSLEATLGIKADGTLWGWGVNDRGQLGLGNDTYYSSPVQIGEYDNWVDVTTDTRTSLALRADGTAWWWGYNYKNPPKSNAENRSSPVLIGANYDPQSNWVSIDGDQSAFLLINNLSELWGVGDGTFGTLGQGDTDDQHSGLVQIGSGWSKVSLSTHVLAIKTDGSLWSWGRGTSGQLGHNDNAHTESPVQVGTDTDWADINTVNSVSFAIKTDGSLWSWGESAGGLLGQGIGGLNNDVSSPTQVGNLTDWAKLDRHGSVTHTVFAIKTDGSLWAWGYNDYDVIGVGNNNEISSPVQVGSDTNWALATHGFPTAAAITKVTEL